MGIENLGKRFAQLGQDAKNSVQKMSESYQFNSKIAEEKKTLEQLFSRMGEAAFEKFSDSPLEGFEEEFEAIKNTKASIKDLEDQIKKMKGVTACPECGKPFAKGDRFCSACGTKLPEWEDPAERFRQDALEAGNEVGDFVNDAADKAKDFFESVADKADAFIKGVSSKLNVQEKAEEAEEKETVPEDGSEGAEQQAEEACCCQAEEAPEEGCCQDEAAPEEGCCCQGEEVKEEIKEAVEEACDLADDAAEAVQEAVDEGIQTAQEMLDDAQEATAQAVSELMDKTEE